jgi:hypothetical protein
MFNLKSTIREAKDFCLGLLIVLFLLAMFLGTQLLGMDNPAYNEGPSKYTVQQNK